MAQIKLSFSNLQVLQLLHDHLVQSELVKSADVLQEEAGLGRSRPDPEAEERKVEVSLTSLVSSKLTEEFSNLQLLQLLHEHLVLSGLVRSADVLQEEAGLEPLVDSEEQPTVYPVRSFISFHPSHLSRRRSRPEKEEERKELSLTSLVSGKLAEEFSSCKRCKTDQTFTTATVLDLLLPHKCPTRRRQESNFTKRFFMSQTGTARNKTRLDRRLIYSRYRPGQELVADRADLKWVLTSAAFSADGKSLYAVYITQSDGYWDWYIKVSCV